MDGKEVLFVILLQWMVNVEVFAEKGNPASSRSVYCMTKRNKRLKGYVFKRFESASFLSCSHSCIKKEWCHSTNFKMSAKNGGKGTCELNKHDISLVNENTVFHKEEGVIFSMHFKVTTILWVWYLISLIPMRSASCDIIFIYFYTGEFCGGRKLKFIIKLKTGEKLRITDWKGSNDWRFSYFEIYSCNYGIVET